jgi:hypothetical protein
MAKEKSAEKRVRVTMEDFVKAWESSVSTKEVAEKTGLKLGSVIARSSKYRSAPMNLPIKSMPRKGGAKLDVTAAIALLATLRNTTVEAVIAEQTKLAVKHAG